MATGKSDYYDVLGVTKTSSADDIKKAYRKQALEWHPDRHQGADRESAEKRFKEINEAYQVLSDPQKRQTYDSLGRSAFEPGGAGRSGGNPYAGGGTGGFGPFTYTYTSGSGSPFEGGDFGNPFDIFESFFGNASPFGGGRPRVPRYSMEIDFMEAIDGVEKTVDIDGKRRTIKIPPGVTSGTRINFTDFLLTISVRAHELFERDGADIYMTLEIPFSLATLGGHVDVPTIKKPVKVKIRSGTQSGTMLRLRGEGAPVLNSSKRGDHYVKITIETPSKLTRSQKKLIEQLQQEGL